MLRQAERVTLSLPVELSAAGYRRRAQLEDLSRSGMFVHTPAVLPVGSHLVVSIAPEGRPLTTVAQVAHAHTTGMGLAFRAPVAPTDHLFAIGVERLLRAHHTRTLEPELRVLIADAELASLHALAAGLTAAGLVVTTATSGLEILTAVARAVPDVVITPRQLPGLDGAGVLEALAREPALAGVPVIVTSSDPADIDHAFAHGAADFVTRPVALPELLARVRRHALPRVATRDAAILRGTLAPLGLTAVLSMLEQEAASGRLEVTGAHGGWLELSRGVITAAGTTRGEAGLPAVLAMLAEPAGSYTLWPGTTDAAEMSLLVRFALLEHARLHDEAARRRSRPELGLPLRLAHRPHAVA